MDERRFQLDRRVNVTGYSLMQCKSKSMVRTVAEESSNSNKAPHASSTPKGSELANLGERGLFHGAAQLEKDSPHITHSQLCLLF